MSSYRVCVPGFQNEVLHAILQPAEVWGACRELTYRGTDSNLVGSNDWIRRPFPHGFSQASEACSERVRTPFVLGIFALYDRLVDCPGLVVDAVDQFAPVGIAGETGL